MPSNLRQTTRECVYSVTYGKLMNIHSTPMALYNRALMTCDIWNFQSSCLLTILSVTQCSCWRGSCNHAIT